MVKIGYLRLTLKYIFSDNYNQDSKKIPQRKACGEDDCFLYPINYFYKKKTSWELGDSRCSMRDTHEQVFHIPHGTWTTSDRSNALIFT